MVSFWDCFSCTLTRFVAQRFLLTSHLAYLSVQLSMLYSHLDLETKFQAMFARTSRHKFSYVANSFSSVWRTCLASHARCESY